MNGLCHGRRVQMKSEEAYKAALPFIDARCAGCSRLAKERDTLGTAPVLWRIPAPPAMPCSDRAE